MSIVSGTVVVTLSALSNNSKRVAFAKDINTIKDKVDEYFSIYGDLPINEDIDAINFTSASYISHVASILNEQQASKLSSEITVNNDTNENFYEIDLVKLGIESTAIGYKQNDADDVYLVTGQKHNVYYLKGYRVLKNRYFSDINIEV